MATNRTKQLVQECVELYMEKLKNSSQNCATSLELRTAHENFAAEIEAEFREKCPLTQKAFVDSNVQKLLSTFKGILEEIVKTTDFGNDEDQNEEKSRKEESTQDEPQQPKPKERTKRPAVNMAPIGDQFRPFYFEEIDNHLQQNEYIQPIQFAQIHATATNNATAKIRANKELSETQEAELKKVVAESLEIFQSRNAMLRKQTANFDSEKPAAIGIDLGTTFCCVGVFLDGQIEIIPNNLGGRTTPSYVRLEKNGEVTVGKNAKDNAYRYPDMTIYDAKRLIGRKFEDSLVQNDMKLWPFDVQKGESGPVISANGKEYPPEQISAYLLQHLKKEAEEYLKCPVNKAVITVPAYFSDAQRQATIDAGEMAGLQVLTILNEPTAAAMAYKMERIHEDTKKVLIFDFGGGTFDVALLETSDTKIEVIAVDGDSHLGGEDIDRSLMQHCAKQLLQETGVDLLKDRICSNEVTKDRARRCLRRIQNHCEESKIDLSTAMSSEIEIDNIVEDHDLVVSITREDMEDLNREVLEKIFVIIDRLLRSAKVNKSQVDDIVLVGGSTRIPMVQRELERIFKHVALNHTIDPHEAVAYGAAIHAAILNGSEEAGEVLNSTIQDVTPMSIGIECFRNNIPRQYSIIVPKDTKIPMERKQTYYTSQDNQTVVKITIYQGENPTVVENILLGVFDLEGVPPAKARHEKLEVTMEIQETGVLKVSAKSESTNGTNSLTIEENRGRIPIDLKQKITRELDTLKL